jgi:hypothetical protein
VLFSNLSLIYPLLNFLRVLQKYAAEKRGLIGGKAFSLSKASSSSSKCNAVGVSKSGSGSEIVVGHPLPEIL